jgi:hypothetical protein
MSYNITRLSDLQLVNRLDPDTMTDMFECRTRDGMAERQLEHICLVIGFVIGMLVTLAATSAMATPWTDENGNPNPECLKKECQLTGIPDPLGPTGGSYDLPPKEKHNGFSCYFAPQTAWVYHAAARFEMTPQHDSAAKNEALDRLERLGDEVAMTKVCRPWQIAAGFKIAEVL